MAFMMYPTYNSEVFRPIMMVALALFGLYNLYGLIKAWIDLGRETKKYGG